MALSSYDKDFIICEEKEMWEKHQLPMLTDEFYNKLDNRDKGAMNMLVRNIPGKSANKKTITNVFSYDILANHDYVEEF